MMSFNICMRRITDDPVVGIDYINKPHNEPECDCVT